MTPPNLESGAVRVPSQPPYSFPGRTGEGVDVITLVAEALKGVRFGEVVIVVVDGQLDRIERVHKSRPYRARRGHSE